MTKMINIKQQPQIRQSLTLSQKQQQSLAILCMPILELHQYLETTMAENVFLEFASTEKEDNDDRFNNELKYFVNNEVYDYKESSYHSSQEEFKSLDIYSDDGMDLYSYLISQLNYLKLSCDEEKIAKYIIYNLNHYGYLDMKIEDICMKLSCKENEVQAILDTIRKLDPPGIASENLSQCLFSQLRNKINSGLAKEIIINYLDDLSHNRLSLIARQTKSSLKEVVDAKQMIKGLNPYPGLAFAKKESINYCYPDIIIRIIDNTPIIIINDNQYASIHFSAYYVKMLKDKSSLDSETCDYLKGKYCSAKSIIRAVNQRKETLYKVAESILEIQYTYFLGKSDCLFPMTLMDISDMTGMHESTISRAVSGKYLAYDKGLIEIKKMFSQAITNNETELTQDKIKKRIKQLINNENPKKPLSDQRIAELLKEENINIARRTINKYREEMEILSTSRRRQY